MYDLIGDIHGHAEKLHRLLDRLGYSSRGGVYSHAERTAIFVGDFIDRGPQIPEVLRTVRGMIDNGNALAVMGNHEFNAIAYQTRRRTNPQLFLRRHDDKNTSQHRETLRQLDSAELAEYVQWFRTLPPWIILDGLRVVHAAWSRPSIDVIETALTELGAFDDEFMQVACTRGTDLFQAVEVVLKGKEVELPDGVVFRDKDGHLRRKTRVQWYAPAQGQTYRSYSLPNHQSLPDLELPQAVIDQADPYPAEAAPVFFGHYWLTGARPHLLAANVACLDFSVAKDGFLCGYRWHQEQILNEAHFVTVD